MMITQNKIKTVLTFIVMAMVILALMTTSVVAGEISYIQIAVAVFIFCILHLNLLKSMIIVEKNATIVLLL